MVPRSATCVGGRNTSPPWASAAAVVAAASVTARYTVQKFVGPSWSAGAAMHPAMRSSPRLRLT